VKIRPKNQMRNNKITKKTRRMISCKGIPCPPICNPVLGSGNPLGKMRSSIKGSEDAITKIIAKKDKAIRGMAMITLAKLIEFSDSSVTGDDTSSPLALIKGLKRYLMTGQPT
jgi:hypothetical protein